MSTVPLGTILPNGSDQLGERLGAMPPVEDSTPRQIQKNAAKFVGAIHSLALEEGIKPPEAAFFRLSDSDQQIALALFGAAIKPSSDKGKKTMEPETAARIGRVLSHINVAELNTIN